MNIFEESFKERDITEVLHFTTNKGILGVLRTKAVLPNSQLQEENTLAFIFQQNSLKRREWEKKWLDYVNLSVTKLNFSFFEHSKSVHRNSDVFWAVLSFSPEILTHPNVCFTTTNNIYPSCIRMEGIDGFKQMFNNPIEGYRQQNVYRTDKHIPSWTTCEQAEVLYLGRLDINYLTKIYVSNAEDKSSIMGQLAALDLSIKIEICPNKFRDIKNDD